MATSTIDHTCLSSAIGHMNSRSFPAFVLNLPEADLPFEGLKGWLLQSDSGQILFNESAVELSVPEHSHGDQWGVVLGGQIDQTIDDHTRTHRCGEIYFIPGEVLHKARI